VNISQPKLRSEKFDDDDDDDDDDNNNNNNNNPTSGFLQRPGSVTVRVLSALIQSTVRGHVPW